MEHSVRKFVKWLNEDDPTSLCAMLAPEFISCDYARKETVVRYPVRKWMRNPGGVMHGGAIAAAMDTSMGAQTFYWAEERVTPTINMLSNFQRPVPLGSWLYVRAHVTCVGRTMIYASAEAWVEEDPSRILVTATGVYHVSARKTQP
jgi:uncharacterized protein (TIGR00369 family)